MRDPLPFSKVGEFMDRYYRDEQDSEIRPKKEYRATLRNQARQSYRIAKKSVRQIQTEQAEASNSDPAE